MTNNQITNTKNKFGILEFGIWKLFGYLEFGYWNFIGGEIWAGGGIAVIYND